MSEPYHNKPIHNASDQDEIDLLDLISTLWAQKFLIILIAALGFGGAYGLSLLQTEEWRSTAVVVAPRLGDTEEFIEKNRAIQRIIDPDKDVKVTELMEKVFNTFLYTAADSDEKHSYLSQTDLFKRLQQNTDANTGALLNTLSQNLSVQLPDEKTQSLATSYTLSFVSDTAESAQNVLSGYIDNINRIAIETSRKEFSNNLSAMIAVRKQQITDIERNLKNTRQVNIDNYNDALLIAQKAGIKSAPGSLAGRSGAGNNVVLEINTNNPEQLYLQGEEVLSALLDVAKNTPITYPSNYYRLQYEIEALEPLLEEQTSFQSFSYLMRPTLPPKRSSPKRAQIAIIGGLVGGVLASFLVLILAAFRNREKTLAATERQ